MGAGQSQSTGGGGAGGGAGEKSSSSLSSSSSSLSSPNSAASTKPPSWRDDDNNTNDNNDDDGSSSALTDHNKGKEASLLSGMPLVHYKCRKRKKLYDRCVTRWYSQEFLPGKSVDQEAVCGDLFDNYRTCMLKGIKKEIWQKQGLQPPKEGSPLDEVWQE